MAHLQRHESAVHGRGQLAALNAPGTGRSEHEKARVIATRALHVNPGGDLLSHTVTSAVPSALEGLTSVFGMGTGVAPPVRPPGTGKASYAILEGRRIEWI